MKAAVSAGIALLAPPLLLIVLVTATASGGGASTADLGNGGSPTELAKNDIPPAYLRWYMDAAQTCPGLSWAVLAAIGKVETDHGRSQLPGAQSSENAAGAGGPMQFLAPTWAAYGVDGNHDGRKDRYDPADAIYGAANYLCANGAGKGGKQLERAIWHYNHADWYVRKVLAQAAKYAQPAASGRGAIAVRAALKWLGTPYSWGGGGSAGPSYGIAQGSGIKGFDCSGLTEYAWAKAGIAIGGTTTPQWTSGSRVPRNQLQPGDLLFFAYNPRDPATIHHVGLNIDGTRMVHSPQTGGHVEVVRWSGNPYRERQYIGAVRPTQPRQPSQL